LFIIPAFTSFVNSFFHFFFLFLKISFIRIYSALPAYGLLCPHRKELFRSFDSRILGRIPPKEDYMKHAVLLGMPNCGKSTLFHLLTGKHVPTGNRSGVTVEETSAPLPGKGEKIQLTDLPGIRSASPSSEDEAVTMLYLRSHTPDLLIAVLDATDLTRQFPLMLNILEHSRSLELLVVFNFCDELEHFPDRKVLRQLLGVPVLAVSGRTGAGISELVSAVRTLSEHPLHTSPSSCMPRSLSGAELHRVTACVGPVSGRRRQITHRMDEWLLRPAVGFPFFFLLMLGILFLTFGPPGEVLTDVFCNLALTPLTNILRRCVVSAPAWLQSLLLNGVLGGVGAVLAFLPRLLLLFFFQTVMEQAGYLSRVGTLFDPLFRRFGLRGDAVTPLLLGFG